MFDCARRCLVLAAGGYQGHGEFSREAAVYDPRSGVWRSVAPLPAPRFGLTLLAQPHASSAYAIGGYELRLPTSLVAEAIVADRGSPVHGRFANADRRSESHLEHAFRRPRASVAAAAAATHAPSFRSVFEYSVLTNSWWRVPAERLWQTADAIDWRQSSSILSVARVASDNILDNVVPSDRVQERMNVTFRAWKTTTRYIGIGEFSRPEPDRCQHGRTHIGCLAGIGMQRDDLGIEVALENRTSPKRRQFAAAWHPPLNLTSSACDGCIFTAEVEIKSTANSTYDGNLGRYVVGDAPRLPQDLDIYAIFYDENSTLMVEY